MELISTLSSIMFPLIIISPALPILLESDINILPSYVIQTLAYQWARTPNILVSFGCSLSDPINNPILPLAVHSILPTTQPTNYHTYVDHYIIPPSPILSAAPLIPPHRQFYLSDVNAYSLIPLRSTIKVSVVPIDVIHPLGSYSFGIKIDAIPGRINPASSSRSLNKGENRGFRSESRGQGHSTTLLVCLVLL